MEALQWYRNSLRRSQRNIGAIVALELATESAGFWARGEHQLNFLHYTQDYAVEMRDACNGRPSFASSVHRHWIRARDVGGSGFTFPELGDHSIIGALCGVLRACRQLFFTHTGSAYADGWWAVRQMMRLAVQADLVDFEYQAFALWWHTFRCRLAFCDSATCTFV